MEIEVDMKGLIKKLLDLEEVGLTTTHSIKLKKLNYTSEAEVEAKVDYIILKIGDKTFSTSFQKKTEKDIKLAKFQITDTKNIGKQNNLWIKGFFTEKENHKQLEKPLSFELNIYLEK